MNGSTARLGAREGLLYAGLAVALALGGCASGTPEAAVKDNTPAKLLTGDAIFVGLGLQRSDQLQRPDSTPRAELVLPPDRTLPTPQDTSASAANAAWPDDPDVARERRRTAALARDADPRSTAGDTYRIQTERSIAEGEMPISQRREPQRKYTETSDSSGLANLSVAEARRQSALAQKIRAEQATTQATTSRRLIEPPAEYRQLPEGAPPPPEKKRRRWFPFFRG